METKKTEIPGGIQKPPEKKKKAVKRAKVAKTPKSPRKGQEKPKKRDGGEGLVLAVPRNIDDPSKLTKDKIQLITDTVARSATKDELQLFLLVCRRSGLDPFARQIYFVKRYDSATGESRGVIQTGIDGFRAIAEKTGEYAGSDEPVFVEPKDPAKDKYPVKATVAVYRIVKGQKVSFTASARWDEYYPGEKLGFMWRKMPYAMLGKCAEAQALRKGFPQNLGGLYIHEEMAQANRMAVSSQPEVDGANAAAPTASKATGEMYDKAIQWIQRENDPATLKEYVERIKASNLYNDEQKKQLVGIIEGRLKDAKR